MHDPAFLEDAKKQRLDVVPITGDRLAQVIAKIYKTPKDVVTRVAETLGRISK